MGRTRYTNPWVPEGHTHVSLQGQTSTEFACTVVELQLLSKVSEGVHSIPPKIQSLLDLFAEVFSEPKGLPPVRNVTHSIPLVT
jgi:hypothetical protein